jgi:carboxypeptidase C (cathepsin A)
MTRWRDFAIMARAAVVLAVVGTIPISPAALGAEERPTPKECAPRPDAPKAVTAHEIQATDGKLAYTAKASSFAVSLPDADAEGDMFYVAYDAKRAEPPRTRPLTFVVNGGPGAAAAYLHLLALGPRIARLGPAGAIPPPPVTLDDNPFTWLSFTDLVFIDPVGTGYSRATEDGAKPFWQFNKDLDSLVAFIRLYLTCEKRWESPIFLAGESYGGFRTASLPGLLASEIGLRLNGLILISPVLEFSFQDFDTYQPMPWALILPSYAATALAHEKSSLGNDGGRPLGEVLAPVEDIATGEFLTWLVRGGPPREPATVALLTKIAGFLGVSEDFVSLHRGRISRHKFARTLLQDTNRYVSVYDGTVDAIDPYPSSSSSRGEDPVLTPLTALLGRAFPTYARDELAYVTEGTYRVLNSEVSRRWEWMSGRRTRQGYQGAADGLKEAMSLAPHLQVLVAHGYYDLVTPYLATSYTIRQMALDEAIRPNLVERIYEGGHMLYTHEKARIALYRDADALYRRALRLNTTN